MSIPSLCLRDYPGHCDTLLELFTGFPALKSTQVLSKIGIILECGDDDFTSGSSLYKKRLLDDGFELNTDWLNVKGTSEEIQEALSWLPAFPHIRLVTLMLQGPMMVDCLKDLHRVFPLMDDLCIGEKGPSLFWELDDVWGLNTEFLQPLAGCANLEFLDVREQYELDIDDMEQMCGEMLEGVSLRLCVSEAVSRVELDALVLSLGEDVEVETDNNNRQWLVKV